MGENTKGVNYTVEMLYDAANAFCQEWWGVDYTGTIELTNTRWKGRRACYISNRQDPNVQIIKMSRPVNRKLTITEVCMLLLHELVHWRLHTTGKPYDDRDEEFVRECLRVGAPISPASYAQKAAIKIAASVLTDESESTKRDTVAQNAAAFLDGKAEQLTLF